MRILIVENDNSAKVTSVLSHQHYAVIDIEPCLE